MNADSNKIRKRIVFADGKDMIFHYTVPGKDSDVVSHFTISGKDVTSHSKCDSLGRKVFDELQFGEGFVSRRFEYVVGEATEEHTDNNKLKSSPTTNLVKQIQLSSGRTIDYEYDAEERIVKVIDSVNGTTEYTYDALGQVLRETVNDATINTVVYDNYGNVLVKNGISYTYDNVWKGLLIGYGDKTISYDKQGNPTSYLGHQLTWEKGRQLKSFDSIQYMYNSRGIRTSKTIDGVEHIFVLDGTNLLCEYWMADGEKHTLEPMYDNMNDICGVVYNGMPYFFCKNLQGDIIAITDQAGAVQAKYSYDAWGVCSIDEDISQCSIATINPYRYRGYYFDQETGFYYLQSRYYDPIVGRFISADDPLIVVAKEEALSTQLFVYCKNNVVNLEDKTGYYASCSISVKKYSYEGIECSFAEEGFNVYAHPRFLSKRFCMSYAAYVTYIKGGNGKYKGMSQIRMAKELFAHMVLFVLGVVVGVVSLVTLSVAVTATTRLMAIIHLVVAAIEGAVAAWLIDKSHHITVNNNESSSRLIVYDVLWTCLPPYNI